MEVQALTQDNRILELLEQLNKNQMKEQAGQVFEMCSYVERLESKLEELTGELAGMRQELRSVKQHSLTHHKTKEQLQSICDHLTEQCRHIRGEVKELKYSIAEKAVRISCGVKEKGQSALYRLAEFTGVRKTLVSIRSKVESMGKDVENTIGRLNTLGSGLRQANRQIANSLRAFMGKETVDYRKKKRTFSKTALVVSPWKAKQKILNSMKGCLDAAIDRVDGLEQNVMEKRSAEIFVEKESMNTKAVRAYSTEDVAMVAENHQYGAEVYEAYQKSKGAENLVGQAESCIASYSEKTR